MTTLISTSVWGGAKVAIVAVTSSAPPASQSNPPREFIRKRGRYDKPGKAN
jgi:hypothetical protein